MTNFIHVTILFLVLATASYGQEEKSIQEAFENYRSAIINDKGEEAVRYVDSRTIQYYSDMVELSKNADSSKVNSLSLLDKMMVFTIRHRASKKEILSFDGKGLLVYAIKKGMIGKNSVANISIGEVAIDKETARGQFVNKGQPTSIYFNFYKEGGEWKVDLTSIFSVSVRAFRKMVDDSGQDENAYLFGILEMLSGRKPGLEIWEKVK